MLLEIVLGLFGSNICHFRRILNRIRDDRTG